MGLAHGDLNHRDGDENKDNGYLMEETNTTH